MVDDKRHVIQLEFDPWLGMREIYVNNTLVLKKRSGPFATDEEYRFEVGGKPAMLGVRGIFIPRFELFVDGKRV